MKAAGGDNRLVYIIHYIPRFQTSRPGKEMFASLPAVQTYLHRGHRWLRFGILGCTLQKKKKKHVLDSLNVFGLTCCFGTRTVLSLCSTFVGFLYKLFNNTTSCLWFPAPTLTARRRRAAPTPSVW